MKKCITILLVAAIGGWLAYHYYSISTVSGCEKRGGIWHQQRCIVDPEEICVYKGYEWDQEGNRCLIIDYLL